MLAIDMCEEPKAIDYVNLKEVKHTRRWRRDSHGVDVGSRGYVRESCRLGRSHWGILAEKSCAHLWVSVAHLSAGQRLD